MDVSYTDHSHIIGKGGGNIKQGLVIIEYYYINTYEIPGDLSCQNMILSHVKITSITREKGLFCPYSTQFFTIISSHFLLYMIGVSVIQQLKQNKR